MNLNLTDPMLIVLAAAVILVIGVFAWLYMRRRRNMTADLRRRFGPEYDRAVREHGSERKAEAKLADREKRVEDLKIRDLDPMEHERFSKQWQSVQSRFVDSPKGAVTEADDLVSEEILYVEAFNPALRLFERLGFSPIEDIGLHLLLEWHPRP